MTTRRNFLKTTGTLAAFSIVPRNVLGKGFLAPSDVINLGFIGVGRQARGLQGRFLETKEINLLAACDVDKTKTENFTKELFVKNTKQILGEEKTLPQVYENYLELLDRKDIDGVVIATPDHWHAAIAIRAAEKGKDIYLEKPLTFTVAEGRALVNAVRKNNRVLQTGSMQRSGENFRKACELVRNGYIGEISEVRVTIGGPPKPVDFQPETVPSTMNWDMWLGPNQPHGYHHFLAPRLEDTFWGKWRYYKGFGGGDVTDWGAHMFDIAQWGLGMDESGPVELYPPTDPSAEQGMVFKYANGVKMIHHDFGKGNAVQFRGKEGIIEVSRSFFNVPDKLKDVQLKATDIKLGTPVGGNHYKDFLNAMRTRQKPLVDVETGHRTCTVCNIANIGYELRKPLKWNPQTEKFDDANANKMLSRKMREPYGVKI